MRVLGLLPSEADAPGATLPVFSWREAFWNSAAWKAGVRHRIGCRTPAFHLLLQFQLSSPAKHGGFPAPPAYASSGSSPKTLMGKLRANRDRNKNVQVKQEIVVTHWCAELMAAGLLPFADKDGSLRKTQIASSGRACIKIDSTLKSYGPGLAGRGPCPKDRLLMPYWLITYPLDQMQYGIKAAFWMGPDQALRCRASMSISSMAKGIRPVP
jgi:hypothetical protein